MQNLLVKNWCSGHYLGMVMTENTCSGGEGGILENDSTCRFPISSLIHPWLACKGQTDSRILSVDLGVPFPQILSWDMLLSPKMKG